MSINISLNSFINGGNTRTESEKIMNEITTKTRNKAKILGNLNPVLTLWHRLQTTLETTNEHIIKRKKSLKVQIIKRLTIITAYLK